MKRNHFVITYAGNKREEVKRIYDSIVQEIDINKIETVIEPFCGTSAFSYYLSTLHPKKFKYILNDNNEYICELYKLITNDEALTKLTKEMDKLTESMTKEKYVEYTKNGTFKGWLLGNYIYQMRPYFYPQTKITRKFSNMMNAPIIQFLKTENVQIRNDDGLKVIEEFKNDSKSILFLDPPYLESCNTFYANPSCKVYEYLYRQNILELKSNIFLALEKMWIIEILFEKCKKIEYDKIYQISKKKTIHQIICNKPIE